MNLEAVEILALAGEGTSSQHWSQNVTRPRYSLTKKEVKEAEFTHRFTCFDVAEGVETDHDVLLAGRSNGAVALWRMVPRNLFGGSNKNDRIAEFLPTFLAHKGAVTCITHTPTGTYGLLGGPLVFTGSVDHTVKIWNAWGGSQRKETCLQTIADQRGGLSALAFAGDGTLIAASRDGNTRLWWPQYGRNLSQYPFFCCVKCLSPHILYSGTVIRSTGSLYTGGWTRFHNKIISEAEYISAFKTGQLRASVDVWCTSVCVAGGEKWTMYCGDSDGTVSVFRRTPASLPERLANAAKKSIDQAIQQLADSEITLRRRWNHLHSLAITNMLLVPEQNYLVSMGNDGVCKILDYLQGTILSAFESRRQSIFTSVAWDLAHEQLVLADASGIVEIWNTYTRSLILREQVAKPFKAKGPRRGHCAPALLGFHSSKADGMLYGMSPSEDCFFRWKIVKAEGYIVLGHHSESIVGLGFQETKLGDRQASKPPRNRNTSTKFNRTVAERDQGVHDHSGEGATDKEVQEGDFGLAILSVSVDGEIILWEAVGKSEKYRIQHPPDEEAASMVVLPGGRLLATGTDKGSVRFWRLDVGAGESFKAHNNTVSALATTRDRWGSLMLASGCFEGVIVLWTADAKDGFRDDRRIPQIDFVLHGAHGATDGSNCEVLCLAFVLADTPLLASAGNDFVVKCWRLEARKGTLVATLEGHSDSIEALVVDGLHLLSASCDGTVRVWSVSSIAFGGSGAQESPQDSPDKADDFEACGPVCVAIFEAHPSGVAGMDIISRAATIDSGLSAKGSSHGWTSRGDGDIRDVDGLLVTCAKTEGVIKIWDYTHVEKDGACGRVVSEISTPNGSLVCCVVGKGGVILYAGTTEGTVLELSCKVTGEATGSCKVAMCCIR